MTILEKVRDFLQATREEFINSTDIDFSQVVLVFGNESTGTQIICMNEVYLFLCSEFFAI